jgi:hypothetical protein|nr:MAG TPA: N-deoxyribosyltransferase [Caudoviricetes sp.]
MSTKYAVISQPMKGIDPDKVTSQREKAEAAVRAAGYEPIDTIYEEDFKYDVNSDNVVNPALWHMGLALMRLSKAHVIYMCDGWDTTRGCLMEHQAAVAFGVDIMYETD